MHRRASATLRTATVVALSVAGTTAAVASVRPPQPHRTQHDGFRFTAGRGALDLDNSRPGVAILGGSELAPGDSVSGDVSLTALAAFPADVSLSLSDLVENHGPGGAHLSSVLRLQVVEEPTTGPTRVRYDGLLRDLGTRSLDTYAPGESRTYHFTATLPDGAGVNAVQGASTTAAFTWNAQEATATPPPIDPPSTPDVPTPQDPPRSPNAPVTPITPPTPGPGDSVTPGAPETPSTTRPPARPVTPAFPTPPTRPRALDVRLVLPLKQRTRVNNNTVIGWATCSRRCRLTVSGRATTATVRLRVRTQRGTTTLTLRAAPATPANPNHRTRFALRLTPAALRALKQADALNVTVSVTAIDAAGHTAEALGTTRVTR